MKERIFKALKGAIVDANGKTNISDKTLNAYAERISSSITDESQIAEAIKPDVIVLKEISANISFEASEAVKALKKEEEEPRKKSEKKSDEPDDLDTRIANAVERAVKPHLQKIEGFETKEKQTARQTLIERKAKEAGIPEWRQKEGFAITDEMDETAIATYLTSVKKNIVTAGLESEKSALTLSTTEEQAKEAAKSWAESLPDK